MSELLKKIRKNSVLPAEILANSKYFTSTNYIPTRVPLLNVALTGKLTGGLTSGVTMIAAPPKHFKSMLMLELMASFQAKYANEDNIIVLYDSEFGTSLEYYRQMGVDTTRIDHRPISNIEMLTSDIVNLLNDVGEDDKVLICIDSLGNTPSAKSMRDALNDDHKVDMTKAKAIKNLFSLTTSLSTIKQVPIIVVNHSYATIETYSKEVASGGRGAQYAAHTLFFITKANEKEGDEKVGFVFTLRAGLSRQVKQDSKFPLTVTYENGLDRYSGLFDLADTYGFVSKKSAGWYWKNPEQTEFGRRSEIETPEFMEKLIQNEKFQKCVEEHYKIDSTRKDSLDTEEDAATPSTQPKEYKLKKTKRDD